MVVLDFLTFVLAVSLVACWTSGWRCYVLMVAFVVADLVTYFRVHARWTDRS